MRLLIVSHTPHYRTGGSVAGWAATVREIDRLSELFESVCHIAPVHEGEADAGTECYRSAAVRLREVRAGGGHTPIEKLSLLPRLYEYAAALLDELPKADVVHVRCPAAIAAWALAVLKARRWRGPLWIKYAGSWNGYPGEPLSFRLQRLWLKNWKDAVVTVNGRSNGQPPNIRSFCNPCLTSDEVKRAACSDLKRWERPVRLMFIGRLDDHKGAGIVLKTVRLLHQRGIDARVDLAGDGPDRPRFEEWARSNGLAASVRFHGWLSRGAADELYAAAHFVVLPSKAEGWPKVLSEGMAHGAVPLATAVGSISQYLRDFGTGRALAARTAEEFAGAISDYAADPGRWEDESRRARAAAPAFTYEAYLENVRAALSLPVPAARLAVSL